jgi:hypothetical protein
MKGASMKKLAGYALGVFLGAAISVETVHAETITYTETATISGALNGVFFSNDLLTLTGTADPANITISSGIFFNQLSLSFSVAGVGGGTFTDTTSVVANPGLTRAGFSDITADLAILFTTDNPVFSTFDLSTSIGPIAGSALFNVTSFGTTAGAFLIESSGDATFTAVASGVPEPSTWAMMILGFAGIGLIGCRRRKTAFLSA